MVLLLLRGRVINYRVTMNYGTNKMCLQAGAFCTLNMCILWQNNTNISLVVCISPVTRFHESLLLTSIPIKPSIFCLHKSVTQRPNSSAVFRYLQKLAEKDFCYSSQNNLLHIFIPYSPFFFLSYIYLFRSTPKICLMVS